MSFERVVLAFGFASLITLASKCYAMIRQGGEYTIIGVSLLSGAVVGVFGLMAMSSPAAPPEVVGYGEAGIALSVLLLFTGLILLRINEIAPLPKGEK